MSMSDFYADRLFNALERNDPAPGMLLVAAPGMLSEEFNRSVVLVIEHNEQLTFGVNLASRSDLAVFNVMPEWLPAVAKPQALYIGGPLNQQSVVGLAMTKAGVDMDEVPHLNRLANRLGRHFFFSHLLRHLFGEVAVGSDFSVRNGRQKLPDPALKGCSL